MGVSRVRGCQARHQCQSGFSARSNTAEYPLLSGVSHLPNSAVNSAVSRFSMCKNQKLQLAMSNKVALRCRSSAGKHSINDLTTDSTFIELKAFVLSLTGFEHDKLVLKNGFPPTPIYAEDHALLKDCGIRHGDVIIAEETTTNDRPKEPVTSSTTSQPPPSKRSSDLSMNHSAKVVKESIGSSKVSSKSTTVKRQIVPANNSCLFASIHFCLHGKVDQSKTCGMRKVVADMILSNPDLYTEALLGRPPAEYAAFIKNKDSWGGAIELSILCDEYSVEIDVIDIENNRTEKFGEQYKNRIMLIYDGIHYDPLYESTNPPRTMFPSSDDLVLTKALDLAQQEKEKRQYTNTDTFTLKCLACSEPFKGQREAVVHATATGHVNFGEY